MNVARWYQQAALFASLFLREKASHEGLLHGKESLALLRLGIQIAMQMHQPMHNRLTAIVTLLLTTNFRLPFTI